MSVELLLREFARVSEAPDAVQRLRRFVLEGAVRGRLVAQDPREGDAASSLAEATLPYPQFSRRAALSKEFPTPGDVPFELPSRWLWCRLSQVGLVVGGGTPPSGDAENFAAGGRGIPWFTPADMARQPSFEVEHGARDLTEKGFAASSATRMPTGTVLFTSRAPIGYVGIAKNVVTTNQGFKSFVPSTAVDSRYAAVYFRAFAPSIDAAAPGTTFKEVSGKIVSRLSFPLPPLGEQHRIVAKVEELMSVCDDLEASRRERESHRDALRCVLLSRLTESTVPHELNRDVRFFLDMSTRLLTKPEHIRAVREAIRDVAIQGRLVQQHADDEPASDLLQRIPVRTRGRGAEASQESIDEEDVPFSVPHGWTWIRFGRVIWHSDSGWSPNAESFSRTGENWAVLKVSAVSWDSFRPDENKQLLPGVSPRLEAQVRLGDFLISRANTSELVAKAVIVSEAPANLMLSDKIVRLDISHDVNHDFVLMVNNHAKYARAYYATESSGTSPSMKNVSRDVIYGLPIPLPPMAEQSRAVARVRELMELCDELQSSLASVLSERGRLLESLLRDALEGSADRAAVEQFASVV